MIVKRVEPVADVNEKFGFCKHCMERSIEMAQEREEWHRLLTSILDSCGGEVHIPIKSILANGGPGPLTQIESFDDVENRCRVIRFAK